jgi:hypothetical protein
MTIVNQQNAGSGNGTGYYGVNSSWTLNLSFSPTPGNTLILLMETVNGNNIAFITFSGSNMTSTFSNGVTNAGLNCFTVTVPPSPGSSINIIFGSGGTQFSTILLEVSGLTNLNCDQTAHSTGSGSTYSSGTTAATTQLSELWVNAYAYYNASTGNDPTGTSPTNGYALLNSGIPVKPQQAGWVWTTGSMSVVSPLTSSGLIVSYKTVNTMGTAGGAVSDLSVHTNTWYGAALTFFGPMAGATVSLIDILNAGIKRYPPLRNHNERG